MLKKAVAIATISLAAANVSNDGRRNYLIPIREKIIMEQATPKDLQWYKTDCSPKQPVVLGDILR